MPSDTESEGIAAEQDKRELLLLLCKKVVVVGGGSRNRHPFGPELVENFAGSSIKVSPLGGQTSEEKVQEVRGARKSWTSVGSEEILLA